MRVQIESVLCHESRMLIQYPILAKYGFKRKAHIEPNNCYETASVEINSLEELFELQKDLGKELILDNQVFKIYDDYIE